jgi:drug/metabolite transporter (DMT)-like permease
VQGGNIAGLARNQLREVSCLQSKEVVEEETPALPLLSAERITVASVAGKRKRAYAYQIMALLVVLRPFGNLSLAWGTRHFSALFASNPFLLVKALVNPYIAVGIAVLIIATLLRMAMLSVADLSFVVPVTAIGYVVSTFLGKFFLREQVTAGRWLGTLLIFLGTVLVSGTSYRTARKPEALESSAG